jgi:amino-acid N-acetyltransferase
MSNEWLIHPRPSRVQVIALLESAALPTSDLTDETMKDFFYVGPTTAPVGLVGVQFYGADALLRSLVVSPEHRVHGLGQRLVEHAEQHARRQGATTVYLLTMTAEPFFRARGYLVTSRDGAPSAIRSTPEFSGLCPASSAFLAKPLI